MDANNSQKDYCNSHQKKYRDKIKNIKIVCDVCNKSYQKGRKWEHQRIQLHKIKLLEKYEPK
mgnify:CR=1 FL=1